jgi:hypothetical protein
MPDYTQFSTDISRRDQALREASGGPDCHFGNRV